MEKSKSTNQNGHWLNQCNISINLNLHKGFVYIITNLINGKKYIGYKLFHKKVGKKSKDSNWKLYTGSNKTLNEDITKLGKDKFTFVMVGIYDNKVKCKYEELRLIINNDAIYSNDYYNEWISFKARGKKI